ncbi:MAG: hypothetical protein ABI693_22195, partial [Bryobacteraceae bacterium]
LTRIQSEDKDLQQFIDMTGFDPRRDLTEVIIASVGQPNAKNGLVLARGNFAVSKIVSMASTQKQTVTSYKGATVIIGNHGGSEPGWFAFPDGSTALLGDATSVKAALDRGSNGGLKADMAAKAQALSARYQAWFLSTVPVSELTGKIAELTGPAPKARGDFFQGVQEMAGGLQFGSIVELGLDATTRSDRDAQALADVMRFMAGMVQQNSDQPEAIALSKVLDTLDLKTAGAVTKITLSIPEQDLEKLVAQPHGGKTTAKVQHGHSSKL